MDSTFYFPFVFKDVLHRNWSCRTMPMVLWRLVTTVEVLGFFCDAVRISDSTASDDELEVIWKQAGVV
jgi:hypothetical protein